MDLILALTIFLSQHHAKAVGPIIIDEARRRNMDPYLVAAVIRKESQFNNRTCFRGAHGLMQVQLQDRSCDKQAKLRAAWYDLYSPRHNIRRGIDLMVWARAYCEGHGHKGHHWLLHYNQGKRVVTTGRIGGYARRVLEIYKRLKSYRPYEI